MKLGLLISTLLCTFLLAGCYREAEEPFQQVDSAAVVGAVTPTSLADIIDDSGDAAVDQGGAGSGEGDGQVALATQQQYITPETVPGQVEQPTVAVPTRLAAAVTVPPLEITIVALPTSTLAFEEQLDPNDICVYTVSAGDNLFQLSLNWNTTVQDIADANQLESIDALSIGQLLFIPGCESSTPEPAPIIVQPPTSTPAPPSVTPSAVPETNTEIIDTPTSGPRVHVVSAGETIASISLRYRVDVNELISYNNLTDPNRLNVGQELLIPG